jgi:hypothetical protein
MRRRDFLIAGSTGAALSVAGVFDLTHASAKALGRGTSSLPSGVSVVLYEPRYAPSAAFAEALMQQGARAFSTQDDIVTLWRGELGRCMDCATPRVAGLTLHSDFDVLRMCAREQKLRVLSESLQRFETSLGGTRGWVTLSSWLIGR